jgi:hypothetical protein
LPGWLRGLGGQEHPLRIRRQACELGIARGESGAQGLARVAAVHANDAATHDRSSMSSSSVAGAIGMPNGLASRYEASASRN